MPKLAYYTLVWLANDWYELREQNGVANRVLEDDQAWWAAWLADHTSFAFQGRQGHLTLLKERRRRGGDYWYAYRSVEHRTLKRYAGRTADLSIPRLEEIATHFFESGTMEQAAVIPQQPVNTHTSPAFSSPTKTGPAGPLLEPKFRVPRLSTTLISRKRLLTRIDMALESKLTILCAPAGSGKTTLVGQWLNARRDLPAVAWLALESGDNDPLRFWRYVMTACQSFHPAVARAALALLEAAWQVPLESPSQEMMLTTLLNDMHQLSCAGVLILEDYHVITEPSLHEKMSFFLEHLPTDMHIVILTRSEPPLPLSRLRARGELCELRASDLRFLPEEVLRFFQQVLTSSSLMLPDEMLQQLDARVEGWAAGLRLLALALRGNRQLLALEQVIDEFTGDRRTIQEYFLSEVFGVLPETLQQFLLQTSVLSRLTGDLCDALIGGNDGDQLLRSVERAGIFLEPLDEAGQWYRYHALFSEAMRAEARRRLGNEELLVLYRRASLWYEQQGSNIEAVETAFQAQDNQRAADLIEQVVRGSQYLLLNPQVFLETQGFHTFRRWLDLLPEEILRERPLLCLGYATATLFLCVTEQIFPLWGAAMTKFERVLDMAEAGFRHAHNRVGLGEVFAFRALILRDLGDLRGAVTLATRALDYLPEQHREGRNFSLSVIGTGKLFDGHLEQAHEIFLQLFLLCDTLENRALKRANAALLHVVALERGKLRQAEEYFRLMLLEAREENDTDDIAHAQLMLSQISYEWNELSRAEQQAQEALELGQRLSNEEFQVHATLVLARIQAALGSPESALQYCSSLQARFPVITPLRKRLWREIALLQVRLQLALGDVSAFLSWERECAQQPEETVFLFQSEREALLKARGLLVQHRAEEALSLLEKLLTSALESGRFHHAQAVRILLVSAKISSGQTLEARQALQELLTLARPQGYLRLFLDEGEHMVNLLRGSQHFLRKSPLHPYVQTILHHSIADKAAPMEAPLALAPFPFEPLSTQEQRVLQLLVAGRSNPQIARELVVSVNTIKAHVQSIYRKLQVNNRVEASSAARLHQLI